MADLISLALASKLRRRRLKDLPFDLTWIRTSILKAVKGSSPARVDRLLCLLPFVVARQSQSSMRHGGQLPKALIFDMSRDSNVEAVQRMPSHGDTSLKHRSSQGRTPLAIWSEYCRGAPTMKEIGMVRRLGDTSVWRWLAH
jgi:hypothetical protein